jgi:uncharacterized protein (TIGR00661 family)
MPYLQTYGDVDVLLSGSNSNLQFELPVKYRSKGLSFFYGNRGGLDYWKTLKTFEPLRVWKEAKALPVEQYDIVLNDFESITALACKLKNVPSVNFGHQASFQSKHSPRPAHKDPVGEFVLQHYAAATSYVGLHFNSYDNFIYNPIIKEDVLKATPTNQGHITVYLSHYADDVLAASLQQIKEVRFEVFSKQVQSPITKGNIRFIPISNKGFTESMITSLGVITGAGFETPAEVLYLGKKLLCLPIKGQYEQWCNAAALEHFNVPIVPTIDELFGRENIDDKKSIANKEEFRPLTHDTLRVDIVANIEKELIENAENIISKNNYDLSSVPFGNDAVTYRNMKNDFLISDNISFFCWFNIFNYTTNDTYEFFNYYDDTNSLGMKMALHADNIKVTLNTYEYNLPIGIQGQAQGLDEDTWYAYLVNIDQRQRVISQYIYKRDVDDEEMASYLGSTILRRVYSTTSMMTPVEMVMENGLGYVSRLVKLRYVPSSRLEG